MIIAITQRAKTSDKNSRFDSLEHDYVRFFNSFGATIIPIPNCLKTPARYFQTIKASYLILSGGGDIHPRLYKGQPRNDREYSQDRDNTEKKLLDHAISHKIPVLGICRGCQFINIHFGGSLIQDLFKKSPRVLKHVASNHKVLFEPAITHKIAKQGSIMTNSYHNDGFMPAQLGKGLAVFAKTSDGIVEGICHQELPIIGLMWHPERTGTARQFDKKIINFFLSKKVFY